MSLFYGADHDSIVIQEMAKTIFVTGLVLGKETDICNCKEVNVNWIYDQPTNLLWVDKIIVTRNEWNELISNGRSSLARANKLIFERLDSEGLIEVIPDSIISLNRAESILDTIESDLTLLEDLYTTSNKENDPTMRMGQYCFCVPSLWTLYAAIEISRIYDASFSLRPEELAYLMALIPRKYNKQILEGRNVAMDEVLSLYLPTVELGHDYVFHTSHRKCPTCKRSRECKDQYLSVIERQLEFILSLRKHDEICMTCEVMDRICERSAMNGVVLTGDELWSDLLEEAKTTTLNARKRMSKVKLWSRIATYVSIGLGAASFLSPVLGATAAIPALASHYLGSKGESIAHETSWVNFVNNPETVLNK